MPAGCERGAVELDRERRTHGRHVDPEDLPLPEPERIRDDQLAEPGDAGIPHECLRVFFVAFFAGPTRKGLLTKRLVRWVFIAATMRIPKT